MPARDMKGVVLGILTQHGFYVTSPDIIAVVDLETGEPITNTNTAPGMKVAVIGAKSPEIWRTPEGLKVLTPPHFGFEDIQWRPIEEIVRSKV